MDKAAGMAVTISSIDAVGSEVRYEQVKEDVEKPVEVRHLVVDLVHI